MHKKNLYVIAGCNGAGKTTASFTILPELLNCKEFINADQIASGLSPFQPESVAVEAGRIMLQRIDHLMGQGVDFAFETTLSARSYVSRIKEAKTKGYVVSLLFFWLETVSLAKERVEMRVKSGGHNIPPDVIERRYRKGVNNLFQVYMSVCDTVMVFDNSHEIPIFVMKYVTGEGVSIGNNVLLNAIKKSCYE